MARFEASFYPGEDNERLPCWDVVEWEFVNEKTGAKVGRKIESFYGEDGEALAKELAWVLQEEYNIEFASEFA